MRWGVVNSYGVYFCAEPYQRDTHIGIPFEDFRELEGAGCRKIALRLFKAGMYSIATLKLSVLQKHGVTIKTGNRSYQCVPKTYLGQEVLR